MNLRELNYILIPDSNDTWEEWAKTRSGRLVQFLIAPVRHLTREGMLIAVAILVSGAAGMDVHFSSLYLVFCGLFGLMLSAWILRFIARIPDVTLRIERPLRVTAGELIEFTAVLYNGGKRSVYALRIHGPFLPWDGSWVRRRPAVPILEPGETTRVQIQARFLCRGDRLVGRFWVASIRPLGLMSGSRQYSDRVRVMVVPRVVSIDAGPAPPLTSTEPPDERGRVLTAGESFELLGIRPYRPGDRIRDLHARSWARLGTPMIREYREAARRRVMIFLDPQMTDPDRESFDGAIDLAASISVWAVGQGALVDLIVAGTSPVEITIGAQVAAAELALDTLAAVASGPAPQATGQLALALEGVDAAFLLFAAWNERTAALAELARTRASRVHVCVVHRKDKIREIAREAGILAYAPEDLGQGIGV